MDAVIQVNSLCEKFQSFLVSFLFHPEDSHIIISFGVIRKSRNKILQEIIRITPFTLHDIRYSKKSIQPERDLLGVELVE